VEELCYSAVQQQTCNGWRNDAAKNSRAFVLVRATRKADAFDVVSHHPSSQFSLAATLLDVSALEMNESAMILSAFQDRLRAGLTHHAKNPAVKQNENIKWSEVYRGNDLPNSQVKFRMKD